MTPSLSVISVVGEGVGLSAHARALDDQTLAPADYEVVLVCAPGAPVTERAARLAAHRPNVRVVTSMAAATESAADRVVVTSVSTVLRQDALARFAAALAEADVVLGRDALPGVVWPPEGFGDDVVSDDLAPDVRTDDAPAFACRRPLVTPLTQHAPAGDAAAALAGARVRALRQPVTASSSSSAPRSSAHRGDVAWDGSRLELTTTLTGDDVVLLAVGSAGARVVARLDGEPGSSVRRAAVELPRETETWDLLWAVRDGAAARLVPADLGPMPPALLDGQPVTAVPGTAGRLSVGEPSVSLVAAGAGTPTVAERADGTLLTIPLPGVAATGAVSLEGHVGLGGMLVPATIASAPDGVPHLTAYVSGLAGEVALSERFGHPKQVPTGLRLRIDGVGGMAVERIPPRPAASPTAPAVATAPEPVTGSSAAQRVRRRLPEPVVGLLSRIPGARRAYGALLRR